MRSFLMIIGTCVVSVWEGKRNDYSFLQFFIRFEMILSIYKIYDMICFDCLDMYLVLEKRKNDPLTPSPWVIIVCYNARVDFG